MISPNELEGAGNNVSLHKICAKQAMGEKARHCRLSKLARIENGVPGYDDGHAVLGYVDHEPTVGERYYVSRYNTCGRDQYGYFITSQIQRIMPVEKGFELTTLNSLYLLEFTTDPLSTSEEIAKKLTRSD